MDDGSEEEWQAELWSMTPEDFEAFWRWIMNSESEGVPVGTP